MARPIQPTPILKGNDAKEFLRDLKETQPTHAVYKNLERCERLYETFHAKMTHNGLKSR